ncbi:MAG: hypothetical protein ACYSUT_00430 [Planctomycetota bacterium]|jgi:hypothetical protein
MPGTLIAVIVGVVAVWGFISFAVYKSITEMSLFDHLPTVENEKIKDSQLYQWTDSRGYNYLDTYLMEISGVRTFLAVWQHPHDPTFFAAYITQAVNSKSQPSKNVKQEMAFDFVTYFTGSFSLTTGSTSSGNLMPLKEGLYRQTLNYGNLDELQEKHNEAVTYLKSFGGVQPGTLSLPAIDYIVDALRNSTEYIRSLSLWPLRGPYWYFIRKHLWHNLTIQQQHEKRKIKLPNEL